MPLHVFQRHIVDAAGNVLSGASVSVADQVTASLVQLYEDSAGESALGNPITTDSSGFVRFYVAPGRYRITATLGDDTRVWEDETIGNFGTDPISPFIILDDPDAATDNTARLQTAFDSAQGRRVHIASGGVCWVNSTLRIPSNSYIYGDGIDQTIIKMDGAVGRDTNLVQIGTRDTPSDNVVIKDLTLDFNADRWDVSGGDNDGENMQKTTLGVYGSEYVTIENVRALNGYKHCIDISAPSYQEDQGDTVYDDQPSRYVWLRNCYANGAGDDNITAHQSSHIWIQDCISEFPTGNLVPSNSNCFEIDDGSRNVFIRNCVARGGVRGLEIKGHSQAPAPYNVHVDGFFAINNMRGIEVRHIGHYGDDSYSILDVSQGSKTFTIDGDHVDEFSPDDDEDSTIVVSGSTGNDGTYTVVGVTLESEDTVIEVDEAIPSATADGDIVTSESDTAFDLFFDNITVVAPRRDTSSSISSGLARHGISIKAYGRVKFGKVLVTDGATDLDNLEYEETDMGPSGNAVRIWYHGRDISFEELHVSGFSGNARAVYISGSSPGGLYIGRLVGRDAPGSLEFFRATSSVDRVWIQSYDIVGNHAGDSGSSGIRLSGSVSATNRKFIGWGVITGYETPVVWNQVSWAVAPMAIPGSLSLPPSTTTQASLNITHGTAPNSPRNGDIWTTTAGVFARINGSTVQLATV